MFLEYMLESGMYDDNSTCISEEVMDTINNIELVDLSESTESPFDIVSKSIYEFAKYNNNTFNVIAEAELKYLKNYGTEPIWESGDHNTLIERFIKAINELIQMAASGFQKIIQKIDGWVENKYKGAVENIDKAINSLSASDKAHLQGKKFKIVKYNLDPGINILKTNSDVSYILAHSKNGVLSKLDKYVSGGSLGDEDFNNIKSSINNGESIAASIRKTVMSNANLGKVDYSSLSDIKLKLSKLISPEKTECDFSQAKSAIDYYMHDQSASKLKSEIKGYFNNFKKSLATVMQKAKNYQKNVNKNKNDKIPSNIAGLYISILNNYSQCISMVYNTTIHAATYKWFQAFTLASHIAKAVKNSPKSNRKANPNGTGVAVV